MKKIRKKTSISKNKLKIICFRCFIILIYLLTNNNIKIIIKHFINIICRKTLNVQKLK